ncbi:CARDB domain-containing protein [Paenibacillus sp. PsM32]|uniref:CARDB domain-containing protein n=1 Tax=Paenibacillus sp. PsM32 TaxID=3030536 RepID=UPI00263B0EDD|nr:CARDB domain-containing protein [Paenibacillus sp. PsM32]MDN4617663.1 CARDB domain-containing protein [Paenibacillus sp. PsM32]
MDKKVILLLILFCLVCSSSQAFAAQIPMLNSYISKNYNDEGETLQGVVPAIDSENTVIRPWQLSRWTGIINFPNDESSTISNYDVFNVKKAYGDTDFDKENGFGLVYKSPQALGDLFDAMLKNQTKNIPAKQLKYFRDTFKENANDTKFKTGHKFYYTLDRTVPFLRTAGIVQRIGIKFSQTKKISKSERQAIYTASKWPELSFLRINQGFKLSYKAYGFTQRDIRIIATKKGTFPNLKQVMSLTDRKMISTDKDVATGSVNVTNLNTLRENLGNDIDVILEDGYGRTAIKTINIEELLNMDFIPDGLTLTDNNQLWVKFHYKGEDYTTSDYISERGIPLLAKVTITGPDGADQILQGMYTGSSKKTVNGQQYSYYFGNIKVGEQAGRYKIKIAVTINNPSHESRAVEYPNKAYDNNAITDEWTRDYTDLVAQSVTVDPGKMTDGDRAKITAKVKNIGPTTQNDVLIRFTDNGRTVYETTKTLPANQVTTVGSFQWTGKGEGNHQLMVDVDPKQETNDIDYSNNTAIGTCIIVGADGKVGICEGNKVSANWSVTYPTITGYDTYKDRRGRKHKKPIWKYKSVRYQESLKLSATVNTKQGIPTDPDHPKDSDRDSRGSWEIIPWSQDHGKDPNSVTRAGYGFELNVKTNYDTDWETKVPKGYKGTARRIGGSYHGPTKVTATIYNTRGQKVDTVNMERIVGDQDQATWVLPKHKAVSPVTGEQYVDRKWYINKNTRDGEYTIKITTDASGKNGLIVCTGKVVTIFGSMYDDTQDLRVYTK